MKNYSFFFQFKVWYLEFLLLSVFCWKFHYSVQYYTFSKGFQVLQMKYLPPEYVYYKFLRLANLW